MSSSAWEVFNQHSQILSSIKLLMSLMFLDRIYLEISTRPIDLSDKEWKVEDKSWYIVLQEFPDLQLFAQPFLCIIEL
jgi:hypothetical protein